MEILPFSRGFSPLTFAEIMHQQSQSMLFSETLFPEIRFFSFFAGLLLLLHMLRFEV